MQLEEREDEALGAQFHAERRVNRAHKEQRVSMRQQHHHERAAARAQLPNALSPVLFYAEFSSLPQHVTHHVHRLVAATVDGNTRGDCQSGFALIYSEWQLALNRIN